MENERVYLKNLNSYEYEHPADRIALKSLNTFSILQDVTKKIIEYASEKQMIFVTEGSYNEITEKQYSSLYKLLIDCCRILDIKKIPKLFLVPERDINAYTAGVENPFICINEGTVEALSEEELRFIIGHELGHIKSGHCLNHTMVRIISSGVAAFITKIAFPLRQALFAWDRMSEYTADRAGFLCCQNVEVAVSVLAKLGGCIRRYKEPFNYNAYLNQALSFKEQQGGLVNSFLKNSFYVLYELDHPLTVLRAAEIYEWNNSNQYKQIINKGQKLLNEVME